jgi:hypothetical protein
MGKALRHRQFGLLTLCSLLVAIFIWAGFQAKLSVDRRSFAKSITARGGRIVFGSPDIPLWRKAIGDSGARSIDLPGSSTEDDSEQAFRLFPEAATGALINPRY